MLRRLKLKLAARLESPLLQLLVLDCRFTCLLVALIGIVLFAVALPVRLWKRTPPGFNPEVRISTLDWIQARALAGTARRREKADSEEALAAWAVAFGNDPCDGDIGANYVTALLRSNKSADSERALQTALWLQAVSPGVKSSQLVMAAGERNEEWDLVIQAAAASDIERAAPELQTLLSKALFRTGRYREARQFLERLRAHSREVPLANLYSEALECVLKPDAQATQCRNIRRRLAAQEHDLVAHEIYLVVCAAKGDLAEFQKTLGAFKQMTDRSIAFDVLHARLLLERGQVAEARKVVAALRAPKTAKEASQISEALMATGDENGAAVFLDGYHLEFINSPKLAVAYARLLVKRDDSARLRKLQEELESHSASALRELLENGISCLLEPTPHKVDLLTASIAQVDPTMTDAWFLAAEILLKVSEPRRAADLLGRIESTHLDSPEYYNKLFVAAEASKDAIVMRRVAERCFRLNPGDLRAAGNYAAMLVMCEEQAEEAVTLSARCLEANGRSLAAKINCAAALVNAERYGPADLLLREVDESKLTGAAQNQLRFIKLKRALRLGNRTEAERIALVMDKQDLYSIQLRWLEENGI